jgi:hypothetical protein
VKNRKSNYILIDIDETGWAQRLSQPLAEEGIDMLYLSTYHTDIFLVEEHHQQHSIKLFKSNYNKSKISTGSDNGIYIL